MSSYTNISEGKTGVFQGDFFETVQCPSKLRLFGKMTKNKHNCRLRNKYLKKILIHNIRLLLYIIHLNIHSLNDFTTISFKNLTKNYFISKFLFEFHSFGRIFIIN